MSRLLKIIMQLLIDMLGRIAELENVSLQECQAKQEILFENARKRDLFM